MKLRDWHTTHNLQLNDNIKKKRHFASSFYDENGGADGARTRDLLRDRQAL